MPAAVQAKMERSFGRDFSATRIHEGAHAAELGAVAYAQGTDIHFAPGHYDPHSLRGQELLGHELAHVVQQSQGRVKPTVQMTGLPGGSEAPGGRAIGTQGVNTEPSLEREADEMGARAARGQPVSGAATPGAESGTGARAAGGSGVVQRVGETGAAVNSEISSKKQLSGTLYHRLQELGQWRLACETLRANGKNTAKALASIQGLIDTYESISDQMNNMGLEKLIAWLNGSDKEWKRFLLPTKTCNTPFGERLIREAQKVACNKAESSKKKELKENKRKEDEIKKQSKALRLEIHKQKVAEAEKKRAKEKQKQKEKEDDLKYQEGEVDRSTKLDDKAWPEQALPAQARVIFAGMQVSGLNDESVNKANVTVFVNGTLRRTSLNTYASRKNTKPGNETWESTETGGKEELLSRHDSEVNLLGDVWKLLNGRTKPNDEVTVQVVSYFGACNGCKERLEAFAQQVRKRLGVDLTLVYYYFEYRDNIKRGDLNTTYGWGGDETQKVEVSSYERRELYVHEL